MSYGVSGTDERLMGLVDHMLTVTGDVHRVSRTDVESWPTNAVAYEDRYSIIAAWYFETFSQLADEWMDAQDQVVDLVSSNVTGIDAKAWDGYLLLVTAGRVPQGQAAALNAIRSNTRRLRKLVLTGDDLEVTGSDADFARSLRRGLAPLLPLELRPTHGYSDPLAQLPRRIGAEAGDISEVEEILDAYRARRPMVGALHQMLIAPDSGPRRGRKA